MRKLENSVRASEDEKIEPFDEERKGYSQVSLPPDIVENNRKRRNSYFEIKESTLVEQKELKEVKKILGFEFREKCRAEIDEYIDCTVNRFWRIYKCKDLLKNMKQCLQKYENLEYIKYREKEIMEERKKNGTSLLRSEERSKYNRFIRTGKDNEWLPETK